MTEAQRGKGQAEAWLASFDSPNTRAAYAADIGAFFAWCEAQGIAPLGATNETASLFQQDLLAGGARASSVRRRVSAVNSFLRSCRPDGATAGEPAAEPTNDRASTTVALTEAAREQVLRALPEQASKAQVLVTMLLLDGLKLDEVLSLDAEDIGGRLPQLEVAVSRDQQLPFSLHPMTSALVSNHLAGRSQGPLLAGRGTEGSRLTRFGADYLVKRAGRDAGLDTPLTSNMLRRTYVSNAHTSGDPLDDIRRRVGHRDIQTTRRYLPDTSGR